ncbi:MAG: single-stranded DNA-binding protein [Verrucomicrobia bacterium CG_4_10_14_3_um_filter_43_23]|nr:MAG: single-stranded DNA-binding protein [Verrucomicrobia bacterium CG1_02_43_26]PIP59341.1 MAG: single-stranded DNA-binding protein [Verrucomicrobia bacterium CG22_combo_CG10-13_8_21_14_all_43_17]PIX57966.1 MAG: single-stranded DNA-binding protein [Verrucomicrobia bacterium CG_4_10_14_3_um_filter_43_23]PIY62832.1 MAG: single-stranded DNA-binding protein [Verrucomicrobia bacterium CG_4_10_14_0_8_um_filter_43_34]PJA44707.1 MAG: single-stranded DNA-binding protein [Verrucomicrobia bacterium CG
MAGFSKVMLMGNLTRDPELRVTPNGTSVCKFGLAISRKYKAQDGSQKEEVTFVDVDAFGKQAEVVSKYFTKGKPIFVEGRLRFDQWENNGEKRSKLSIVLESFQFIGGRDGEGNSSSSNQNDSYASSEPAAVSQSSRSSQNDSQFDIDDDVPF